MDIGKIIRGFLGQPEPSTELKSAGFVTIESAAVTLAAKLREYDSSALIFLPDSKLKTYSLDTVKGQYQLEEIQKLTYVAETHDCDDFAAKAFAQGLGLIWTDLHALNWFFSPNCTLFFVEPQSLKVATDLESWQYSKNLQFFIGR